MLNLWKKSNLDYRVCWALNIAPDFFEAAVILRHSSAKTIRSSTGSPQGGSTHSTSSPKRSDVTSGTAGQAEQAGSPQNPSASPKTINQPNHIVKKYFQKITPGYLGLPDFLKKISLESKIAPSLIIIGFENTEAKTVISRVSLIRDSFEKPIDETEIQNAIYKLERRIFEKKRGDVSLKLKIKEINLKIASAFIMKSLVNDGLVYNPLNFQGRTLGFIMLNTFAGDNLLNFFNKNFRNYVFENSRIYWLEKNTALSLNLFENLKREVIFINISPDKTDIGISKPHSFNGTYVFSWGANIIKKKIAELFNMEAGSESALRIEEQYKERNLSCRILKKIKEYLLPSYGFFISGVELSIKNLLSYEYCDLPNEFILVGKAAEYPDIQEMLQSHRWPKNLGIYRKKLIVNTRADILKQTSSEFQRANGDLTPDLSNLIIYSLNLMKSPNNNLPMGEQNLKRIIKWF